jgi:hypothetical protein
VVDEAVRLTDIMWVSRYWLYCWGMDLEGGVRSEGGWLGHGWRCMSAHWGQEGA